MNANTLKSIFVLSYLIVSHVANCQESVNSSGGNETNLQGEVNYSIGQVFYQTHSSATEEVAEGVQQPYEIFEITNGTQEIDAFFVSIAPNPTHDFLKVEIQDDIGANIEFGLIDNSGKLLYQNKMENSVSMIDMQELPSGYYLLQIKDDREIIKTFKIIKK